MCKYVNVQMMSDNDCYCFVGRASFRAMTWGKEKGCHDWQPMVYMSKDGLDEVEVVGGGLSFGDGDVDGLRGFS
jgi:hypothetical protein